ncbi:MAG: DUF1828 domain-containing protein [Candidatus Kapaibacterium sp.]
MSWVDTYLDEYYNWLRKHTFIDSNPKNDWALITTPFIGAFNDLIEIYVRKIGDRIILSDSGETINNLELQGVKFNRSKPRQDILNSILINYGIKQKNSELIAESNGNNFAQIKHNFISAILEINDLYVLSDHKVASIFKEDVRNYLEELGVIYTPDFICKGKTGLEFNFDFQIAHQNSEIVIKSYNTINKSNLSTFLFSWEDIRPVREKSTKKDVRAIAVINDTNQEIKPEYLDALINKDAEYIEWTKRNSGENKEKLIRE